MPNRMAFRRNSPSALDWLNSSAPMRKLNTETSNSHS
jgi:hypothetical protein